MVECSMAYLLESSPITSGIPVAARPIGIMYKNTGCKYAPACLTCPFSICCHDDPKVFIEKLGHGLEGRFRRPKQAQ